MPEASPAPLDKTSAFVPTDRPRMTLAKAALWVAGLSFILFTRLYKLDLKPVQHDESMFAFYSYQPYDAVMRAWDDYKNAQEHPVPGAKPFTRKMIWDRYRQGYEFMPILHGPLLEWVTSLVFLVLGDSTYNMRLVPSLCGLGIMLVLFLLRKEIGPRGAYLAIFFLAVSPTTTFFTRFIRPDNYMLLEYLLIIHAGWRYSKSRKGLWLAWLVFLLWLGSATHETYVIYYFFLGTFAFGNWLHGVVNKRPADQIPFYRELKTALLRHWWALLLGSALGALACVTLMTSFFSESFLHHWKGHIEDFKYWENEHKKHRIEGPFHFYLLHLLIYELPAMIFFVAMMVRQMWPERPSPSRARLRALFLAWLLGSVALLNLPMGKCGWLNETNADGKLRYVAPAGLEDIKREYSLWNYPLPRNEKIKDNMGVILGVKGEKVPFDFDTLLHLRMGFHVWMFAQILLVVMITGWIHLNHGRVFHAWIDYWACGSFLAYGYAGEKVPWVTWHITLPMGISCGLYAAMLWERRFMFAPAVVPVSAPAASAPPKPDETPKPTPAADPIKKSKKKKGQTANQVKPREDAKAALAPQLAPNRAAASSSAWRPSLLANALIVLLGLAGLAWNMYLFMIVCFIQPGSALERHTYASSHTEYRDATESMMKEAKERFDGVNTPIAWTGDAKYPEPGWPSVWVFRQFPNKVTNVTDTMPRIMVPLAKQPGKQAEAVFALVQKDMLEKRPLPPFADRYEWKLTRFRHYWVPTPLDWDAMKRVGLLLRSEDGLSPEDRITRQRGVGEWKKLWSAFVLHDEAANRDAEPGGWHNLGGADIYVGRLLPEYLPKKEDKKPEAAPPIKGDTIKVEPKPQTPAQSPVQSPIQSPAQSQAQAMPVAQPEAPAQPPVAPPSAQAMPQAPAEPPAQPPAAPPAQPPPAAAVAPAQAMPQAPPAAAPAQPPPATTPAQSAAPAAPAAPAQPPPAEPKP